jgi:hypothetical protein
MPDWRKLNMLHENTKLGGWEELKSREDGAEMAGGSG